MGDTIDVFHAVMGLLVERTALNILITTSLLVLSRERIISFEIPSIPADLEGFRMYEAFSNSSVVISKSRSPVSMGL